MIMGWAAWAVGVEITAAGGVNPPHSRVGCCFGGSTPQWLVSLTAATVGGGRPLSKDLEAWWVYLVVWEVVVPVVLYWWDFWNAPSEIQMGRCVMEYIACNDCNENRWLFVKPWVCRYVVMTIDLLSSYPPVFLLLFLFWVSLLRLFKFRHPCFPHYLIEDPTWGSPERF